MADLSNVVRMLIHQLDATRSYLLPSYCDESEKARAVIAFAESALAAEPPAPAEPDTDAVLTLAAIIREVDGNNSLGAAALAEAILAHPNAASVFQPTAPAPAADGERDHVPGAGNMVPAAYAARLRQCHTHGQLPANAWGCPECLRELREELARLRATAADGEREELAQWLEDEAVYYKGLSTEASAKATRAAALLRQQPPEGLSVEEYYVENYYHVDSGARIVREPCDEKPGWCWTVRNSRHVSPCTEFRTVADALAALRQARRQEVGDE